MAEGSDHNHEQLCFCAGKGKKIDVHPKHKSALEAGVWRGFGSLREDNAIPLTS